MYLTVPYIPAFALDQFLTLGPYEVLRQKDEKEKS